MAPPTREAIAEFTRVTGASESLARRKLEECGGNLDEAVNAHFAEAERYAADPMPAVSPRYNYGDASNQVQQAGDRGLLPLLSAARSFRPSLLLDSKYRRNLYDQIGSLAFPNRRPPVPHTGELNSGYERQQQHHILRPWPVIEGGHASRHDELHLYGDNREEEMIRRAVEASKRESSSGSGRSQMEVDELAHVMALSLKTAEEEKQIRERKMGTRKGKATVRDSSHIAEKSKSGMEKGPEVVQEPLWDILSTEELNEAILLEAALYGEIPERTALQHASSVDRNKVFNPQLEHHPPPPSLVAERMVRKQQDLEYHASLLADREKEAIQFKKDGDSYLKKQCSYDKICKGEDLERLLAAKASSLPPEPVVGDENTVTLVLRMPDGQRHGRRFLKSHKLQFLFDFIDAGRAVEPGTYRVVRQYPRQAFGIGDCESSLEELGLTSKQEVLFLELI